MESLKGGIDEILKETIINGVDILKAIESLLNEYRDISLRIKSVEIEIQSIGGNMGNVPGVSYGEKVSSSRNISSSVENEIIRAEEKEHRLKMIKKKLELDKMMIDNALTGLTERELEVINLRYLRSKLSMQIVADRMFLSKGTISRINREALEKLKRIINVEHYDSMMKSLTSLNY